MNQQLQINDLYEIASIARGRFVSYPDRPCLNSSESKQLSQEEARTLALYEATLCFLRAKGFSIVGGNTKILEPTVVDKYRNF